MIVCISSIDFDSNIIKLVMKVGMNKGVKQNASRNVRFKADDIVVPCIFLIRKPYQT